MAKSTTWMERNNVQPWHLAVLAVAAIVTLGYAISALSGAVARGNQKVEDRPNEFVQTLDPNSELHKILSDK